MDEKGFADYFQELARGEGFLGEGYFSFADKIQNITVIAIIVVLIAIVIFLFYGFKIIYREKHELLNPYANPKTLEDAQDMYLDDWGQIKQFVNSLQEAEWKLAIIQADKLVDEVLKVNGYQGESMGERLMSIDPNRFTTLQELWEAHKLRNIIVHEMDRKVGQGQAKQAVESYERFLKEIGFFA